MIPKPSIYDVLIIIMIAINFYNINKHLKEHLKEMMQND